ncbi:MAG: hypothetical protein RLZZ387_3138 [Chloroflexota bacterium]
MFNFDQIIERRGTGSAKWEYFPEDVLPMWVADMDFPSPEPVVRALQERVAHGFFGYESHPARLAEVICERMARLYQWSVTPDQIVFLPSLVTGINVVCRAAGSPGDSILTLTPVYPPFLSAPGNFQLTCDTVELRLVQHDRTIGYEVDFDAFEAAFHERTRMFLLCNPHNPTGVAYDRATLERFAEVCARHDVIICSDEIHCDLLLGGAHTPIAALSPEIADRTITLMAPSKTFNLPGLKCGFAIVTNPELRKRVLAAENGIVPHINIMGPLATLAAYTEGGPWLEALLPYLAANRDLYVSYLVEHMPQLRTTVPEATYLGWIDCRGAGITGDPYAFFLKEGKVALSRGADFGRGGEGFVRFNFATPRALLLEGLERMRGALEGLS